VAPQATDDRSADLAPADLVRQVQEAVDLAMLGLAPAVPALAALALAALALADPARLVDPDASTTDHHVAALDLAPMVPRDPGRQGNPETADPVCRRPLLELFWRGAILATIDRVFIGRSMAHHRTRRSTSLTVSWWPQPP